MDNAQFAAFKATHADAEYVEESGIPFVLIPKLTFHSKGVKKVMRALLCPAQHTGYTTRLFLEEQVPTAEAQNWNPFTIRNQTWWACSWQNVPASLPWLEILANHLRPLK